MKSKTFFRGLMNILIISLSFSCIKYSKQNVAENLKKNVDSIRFEYYRYGFLPFAAITPEDFTNNLGDGSLTTNDSVIINKLTKKISKLEIDTVHNMIDTRIMLIIYNKKIDTLWVSTLPGHNMQYGRKMIKPDSCLWVLIRNILIEKDSVFKRNFSNAPGYN